MGFLSCCKRRRPYSYPGDALPPEKQLDRVPDFVLSGRKPKAGRGRTVEGGWRPLAERDPDPLPANGSKAKDLLPHKVAGQQVWAFEDKLPALEEVLPFDPVENPNAGDSIFRAAQLQRWKGPRPDPTEAPPADALAAARKGFAFYQMIQCDDGQWAGDYGGPHFLLPGFVIAAYVTAGLEAVLPRPYWKAMEAYLRNHQQADGGWGSHIESPSTLFGTVLNYVALRLVGADADDPACVDARNFMTEHGGALYAPSWAKFWLAVLGVYEWQGIAPVPPEMWLLPSWFPVHPGRFWCHCRMVYLPMCYLYARRFSYNAAADPVTAALRVELFSPGTVYGKIDWPRYLHTCAELDNYSPLHWSMRLIQNVLYIYECLGPPRFVRERSLRFVEEYLRAEDQETNFLTIGPVSKALHLVCAWATAGGNSQGQAFKAHVARVPAYLWLAEDGMKVQGYNGSMIWDTSFALQAVAEAGLQKEFSEMSSKAWAFLVKEQVRVLPHGDWRHWRQPILGGWGFSTAEQAWPVSDTTAEAFKAVLALNRDACTSACTPMPDQHLCDTVQFLLSYQNSDGGWATYECCRGWPWYELMNPSEVFGEIMIDYSYVECSASAMTGLVLFSKQFPDHRSKEIARAIQRGASFIRGMQRDDGSWYGCWGVSFTYGCWFGIEGLLAAGEEASAAGGPIQRCVRFLLERQGADGGWGEAFDSCYNREYGP
jgi:squalene/oxidosqualene cyclase-like protein